MFESQRIIPRSDRSYLRSPSPVSRQSKQRQAMLGALILLVLALGTILYIDRDFWFPRDQDAASDAPEAPPTAPAKGTTTGAHKRASHARASRRAETTPAASAQAASDADSSPAPPVSVTARTAIPPLEVQVVSAGSHRTLHPGSNSVLINLERGDAPTAPTSVPATSDQPKSAASVTNAAAERVHVSAETASIVTHTVTPGYPLLARQMKVQGSVILQALIGSDGLIEDLHVLSGPPMLASAAEEAVRQWHFKPHYQGVNPVETQTKITVNFTISTN